MASRHAPPLILRNPLRRGQDYPPTNLAGPPNWPDPPAFSELSIDPADVDARLVRRLGPNIAIRQGILPLKRAGAVTVLAAQDPEKALITREALETALGPVALAKGARSEIETGVVQAGRSQLVWRSEHRTQEDYSCRRLGAAHNRWAIWAIGACASLGAVAFPTAVLGVLTLWAAAWLFLGTILRLTAVLAAGWAVRETPRPHIPETLPMISVLVPLFEEKSLAERLILRLSQLDYPKDRLEICLVVEANDWVTRSAINRAQLPASMRQVVVPAGSLKTKPRAMNYALDFVRGDIIGVYDAEDAPAENQLRVVAAEFSAAPRDVACLQGRLDFYNARTNWLSRCFTIDYATWFRVILPGLSRLKLVVPLGGTTLFFRRDVLEQIGAWDAHNVTEDADLGVRLARYGWRTLLISTTTEEEANCRTWPWIKQRSRWIKGYAMTWAVHMRQPKRLLSDLGWRRFLGFQVIFLGSISQVALAPLLWSFWLVLLGLPHPVADALPRDLVVAFAILFLLTEISNIAIGTWACREQKHRWLMPWVPTMHFYFPLAAVAAWKGLSEIARKPFYWDKTAHGLDVEPASPPPRPV